jgi:hypothetical protein
MTKDEILKQAGYVPKQGRPRIFNEKTDRLVIQIPKRWKAALLKIGSVKIREVLGKLVEGQK